MPDGKTLPGQARRISLYERLEIAVMSDRKAFPSGNTTSRLAMMLSCVLSFPDEKRVKSQAFDLAVMAIRLHQEGAEDLRQLEVFRHFCRRHLGKRPEEVGHADNGWGEPPKGTKP